MRITPKKRGESRQGKTQHQRQKNSRGVLRIDRSSYVLDTALSLPPPPSPPSNSTVYVTLGASCAEPSPAMSCSSSLLSPPAPLALSSDTSTTEAMLPFAQPPRSARKTWRFGSERELVQPSCHWNGCRPTTDAKTLRSISPSPNPQVSLRRPRPRLRNRRARDHPAHPACLWFNQPASRFTGLHCQSGPKPYWPVRRRVGEAMLE